MTTTLRAGVTKRGKRSADAAARATAAVNGTTSSRPRGSLDFVPVGATQKRRRLPKEPKFAFQLHNAPALWLPGRQNYTQGKLSRVVSDNGSAIQRFFSTTASSFHGLSSEVMAIINADDDGDDTYGLPAFQAPEPALSRHRRRRLAQHQRWQDIVNSPRVYLAYLARKHDRVLEAREPSCVCVQTRQIKIMLADWNGSMTSVVDICECTSVAERLLSKGYFPCAPKCPSIAFSMDLLDFIGIHCLNVAPNFTAWADTLEAFWARKAEATKPAGRLRKRLGAAVTWYQALDNRAEHHVSGVVRRDAELMRVERVAEGQRHHMRPAKPLSNLNEEDMDVEAAESAVPMHVDLEGREAAPSHTKPDEDTWPSARLQAICPLCFGGGELHGTCKEPAKTTI